MGRIELVALGEVVVLTEQHALEELFAHAVHGGCRKGGCVHAGFVVDPGAERVALHVVAVVLLLAPSLAVTSIFETLLGVSDVVRSTGWCRTSVAVDIFFILAVLGLKCLGFA